MKIENIEIDGHIITFNPGLNVLIGKNGCGKSRIFDKIKSDIYDDDRYDIGFFNEYKSYFVFITLLQLLENKNYKDKFLKVLQEEKSLS